MFWERWRWNTSTAASRSPSAWTVTPRSPGGEEPNDTEYQTDPAVRAQPEVGSLVSTVAPTVVPVVAAGSAPSGFAELRLSLDGGEAASACETAPRTTTRNRPSMRAVVRTTAPSYFE